MENKKYYEENEAAGLLRETGERLLKSRAAVCSRCSVSARISPDEFLICVKDAASDSRCGSDVVRVRISDCSYEGDKDPGSDKSVHAAVYTQRQSAGSVICSNQFYAAVVSAECRDVSFAPCIDYAASWTSKLRDDTEECIAAFPDTDEFLMARRGALIAAADCDDAIERAETLEKKCRELVEKRTGLCCGGSECGADQQGSSEDGADQQAKSASGDSASGEPEAFDTCGIDIKALPYVKTENDPYIMSCCEAGGMVRAYVDDFARMIGPDMQTVNDDSWEIERALLGQSTSRAARSFMKMPMTGAFHRMGGQHPAVNALTGRNAVLVKGKGAVCAAGTESEAEAAAMAVSMNCAAACYVRRARPLGALEARILRCAYLTECR